MKRREAERSVRSVAIVVVRKHGEDVLEERLVEDEQPVKTLRANGAHEPFCDSIRLRGTKRRADDLEPAAAKDLIKTTGEFLVPVANQEAE